MAGIVGLLSTSISTTEELLKLERMNCGHKLVHLKITEWQRLFTAACYSGLYEEDEGRSTCPCKTLMATQQQHPLKLCWTKAKASLQTYRDMFDRPESSEIQLRNGKGCLQLHAIPGWMRRMKGNSECCCWIAVSAFKRTYWSTGILRNTIVGPCCSAVTWEKLTPSRRSVCLVYPSNIELSRRILRRQVFTLRNLRTQSADNTEGYTIYSVYRETRPVTIGSIKVFNEWEGISFWHLRIGSLQGFLIPPKG